MKFLDTFLLAWRTVRGNRLRTGLTVAIIAFGIMALVGIITAIKAMNQKLSESFSTMGANAFTIRFKERNIRFGGGGREAELSKKTNRRQKKSNLDKRITREEAEAFIRNYPYPAITGLSIFGNRNSIVSRESSKTSPNVMVMGGDENYVLLNSFKMEAGRNMNRMEVESGGNVCLLGYDVADRLFREGPQTAVNSVVRINNIPYRVLGVLGSRGSTLGFSRDNMVLVSYRNIERNFTTNNSYVIAVLLDNILQVNEAMGEAEATFRPIRRLTTTEESNFALDRSDSVAERAMNSLGFLTISATVIGFITLIGAAIGFCYTDKQSRI